MEELGREIVHFGQHINHIKYWARGWINGGKRHFGLSGEETEFEADVIKTLHKFWVSETLKKPKKRLTEAPP